MKFNFDDLHSVLIKSLPEEIWNPEILQKIFCHDKIDCITF